MNEKEMYLMAKGVASRRPENRYPIVYKDTLFEILRKGDIVCTYNPTQWLVSKGIIAAQKWHAPDSKADKSHALFIIDVDRENEMIWGFEAGIKIEGKWGWRIGSREFLSTYAGAQIDIIRHYKMTDEIYSKYFPSVIEKYQGKKYPTLKLITFLSLGLARRIGRLPVCSELTMIPYFYWGKWVQYRATYPDKIADAGHPDHGVKGFYTLYKFTIAEEDF